MSKKEKRILVVEVNSDCKAFRWNYDPFDEGLDMYCDKSGQWVRITDEDCAKCKSPVLAGITRAEAVKRMAKALCKKSKSTEDCQLCSICWEEGCNLCDFDAFAEAALDALLGKEAENGNN